jgi:membrane peptidoglycan carboxypeptidase
MAPFFCDYLQQYLLASPALGKTVDERRHRLYSGGLTITSTLDPRFQRAADRAVSQHVFPTDKAIGGMAMVQPGTGYVRALAQSRPMGRNKKKGQTFLNYVVPDKYGDSAGFQPGSTFKVFVLSQAIKMGIPLNTRINAPHTIEVNQSDFSICGGKSYPSTAPYKVTNSTYDGVKNLYTGTQQSVNTFYIQLEQMTGLCGPWRLANEMGIHLDKSQMVPAFTLGVSDVSPLEMAEAYATFPARGVHCASTPILQIRDRDGNVMPFPKPKCNRVLKPAQADAVNDILRGVQEPGGFGYDAGIALNQPSAGKTGTVAPAKSVWFIGYTPTLVTSSMIAGAKSNGNPRNIDYQVIGGVNVGSVHGSSTAGPMWYDAMKVVQEWLPNRDFVPPDPSVIAGQPVTIPSFTGYDPQTAAQQLTRLGLKPQISATVNSSAPAGTVAYTTPSSQGASGQTVLIYISNGYTPPPPPTPTPPSPTGPKPGGGTVPGGGGPSPGGGGTTPGGGGTTPGGGGTSPGGGGNSPSPGH